MLVGFRIAGALTYYNILPDGHDWEQIWLKPAIFAFTVLILFLYTFKTT